MKFYDYDYKKIFTKNLYFISMISFDPLKMNYLFTFPGRNVFTGVHLKVQGSKILRRYLGKAISRFNKKYLENYPRMKLRKT